MDLIVRSPALVTCRFHCDCHLAALVVTVSSTCHGLMTEDQQATVQPWLVFLVYAVICCGGKPKRARSLTVPAPDPISAGSRKTRPVEGSGKMDMVV